jgi:hypothetical protein
VDNEKRTPSREEQAKKAERRKILDRLNSMDTGALHHDREHEGRRGREIDVAREGTTMGIWRLKRANYS